MSKKRTPAKKKPETEIPQALNPDADIPEADFEDRVLLYWERNRKNIIISLIVVAIALIGYHATGLFLAHREKTIGEAYNQCEDALTLVTFAEEHSGHDLEAVAYMKAANISYKDGSYSEAQNYFQKAMDLYTEDALMSGRCQLGIAMSKVRQGSIDDGEAILNELKTSDTVLDATRAEAAFSLAVIAWEKEDYQVIHDQATFISGLKMPGDYWFRRIQSVVSKIPANEG